MKTTIYQKFVSRYAETFTMVEIRYDDDTFCEVVPHAAVSKLKGMEFCELVTELVHYENVKAEWED